jgi:hypothetical protein
MKRIVLLALCLIAISSVLQAATGFDVPLEVKQVTIPPVQTPPPGKPYAPSEATDYHLVSCFYFSQFVVKEINECAEVKCEGKDDEGAYRLSVQPLSADALKPPCQIAPSSKEITIPFAGHFMGAKSRYFFFREPLDGGDKFTVFDGTTGQKSFEESTLDGKVRSMTVNGALLKFHFKRSYLAQCSPGLDAKKCWDDIKSGIKKDLMIKSTDVPDCSEKFRGGHMLLIGYDAQAVFDGSTLKITPMDGAIECSPVP